MSDLASVLRGVVPEGRLETVGIFSCPNPPSNAACTAGGADDHPARERVEDARDTDVNTDVARRRVLQRGSGAQRLGE